MKVSEEQKKQLKKKIFQKVINGEFIPDERYVCGNIQCHQCKFYYECDGGLSQIQYYEEFKPEYPEYFI